MRFDNGAVMIRAQCIIHRDGKLLMVRLKGEVDIWWCLPGGAVEPGETPAEAALRELEEECRVEGTIVHQLSHLSYSDRDETYTFLVDIGDQEPQMGIDPEFEGTEQMLVEIRWLRLDQIPERDRAFIWAGGLLGVEGFWEEVKCWGNEVSYPGL